MTNLLVAPARSERRNGELTNEGSQSIERIPSKLKPQSLMTTSILDRTKKPTIIGSMLMISKSYCRVIRV